MTTGAASILRRAILCWGRTDVPTYTRSRGDKKWLGAAQDLIANAGIERLRRQHVDPPAMQQSRELALDADEFEARNIAGLELHQDVDVAVGAEIVPKDGAKQSQPCDVMPSAERRHRVTID